MESLSLITMNRSKSSLFHSRRSISTIGSISLVLLFIGLLNASQLGGNNFAPSTAYAQFTIPDNDDVGNATTTTTTMPRPSEIDIQSASTFLLRGFIGSTVAIADNETTTRSRQQAEQPNQNNDYVVTGRWRMFVDEATVQRFVANLTVAKIEGSESSNIIIENLPTRPDIESDNNNNTMTAELTASVHPSAPDGDDNNNTAGITAPVLLEIMGNDVIKLDLSFDESRTDNGGRLPAQLLRSLDESTIYGTIDFQEISG